MRVISRALLGGTGAVMSETSFGVNDANAVKLWSKSLTVAERNSLELAPLIGEGPDSIIQHKTETKKDKGDRVRFSLRTRLTGDGKTENETAEGNGEALSFYYDDVVINELGHVVASRSENTIDAQRVPFNLRDECKAALGDWFSDRMSVSFFNQVCGYTPQTNTKFTGLHTPTAHTTNRKTFAGAAVTTDQGLGSSDTFNLNLIDAAVEKAKIGSNIIRPVRIGGKPHYVMYLHPYQVRSMRQNTSTGQWLDIQKSAMAGADSKLSPLFTGSLGVYNGVILRESQDVTQGVNSSTGAAITTVRRAVLLGAQAAVIAHGTKSSPGKYRWNEELLDHKRKLEVSAWTIFGLKKTVWNSEDFGAITVSTYAVAA